MNELCRTTQEQLGLYSAHALDRGDSRRVRAHLISCPTCRAEWEALAQLVRALDAVELQSPPRDLWPEIRVRLPERPSRPSFWPRIRRSRRVFALASLATVISVVMFTLHFAPQPSVRSSAPVAAHATTFVRGHVLAGQPPSLGDPVARVMLALETERRETTLAHHEAH